MVENLSPRVIEDIKVKIFLANILEDNLGNRLTKSLCAGLIASISQGLLEDLKVTTIPADLTEKVALLEAEVLRLRAQLPEETTQA